MTTMTEQTLPRVIGVGRDAESPGFKSVLVAFERPLNDDELRALHELLSRHAITVPVTAAKPVAWGLLAIQEPELTNDAELADYWKRKGRTVTPFYTAAPAQANVRDAALEALLTRIDDAWANYERMGEVCSFEGQPMIYASTLEEIVGLRRTLRTTSTPAGKSQKGGSE
jgi:hypothetical protein